MHNLPARADVEPAMARLARFGGVVLKEPAEPPHGGYAGYVADPDGHAWEIAWNPAWSIDDNGFVRFGV